VREVLMSEKAQKRGIFKPSAIANLINRHVSGKQDLGNSIWVLLMLELWFNRFID
jgi:asparagine synthase (glutamine-hydrolysing)